MLIVCVFPPKIIEVSKRDILASTVFPVPVTRMRDNPIPVPENNICSAKTALFTCNTVSVPLQLRCKMQCLAQLIFHHDNNPLCSIAISRTNSMITIYMYLFSTLARHKNDDEDVDLEKPSCLLSTHFYSPCVFLLDCK